MITLHQKQLIQDFLATNPDEFCLIDAVSEIFHYKKETVEGKALHRRTFFVLPDTVYFNYGRGVRSCFILEQSYNGFYVRVFYGTIDDASMAANIYVDNEEKRALVYDKLVELLHLGTDKYHLQPTGLSFANPETDNHNYYAGFEQGFKELLDLNIRPFVNYTVIFDYN